MASPCISDVEVEKSLIPIDQSKHVIYEDVTWILCIAHPVPARFNRSSRISVTTLEVMGIYSSFELAESKLRECQEYYLEKAETEINLEIRKRVINCDLWSSEQGPAIYTIKEQM